MKPEYVARKSACEALSFLWILSCILIIPAVILAFRIVAVKKFRMEFYQDKIRMAESKPKDDGIYGCNLCRS